MTLADLLAALRRFRRAAIGVFVAIVALGVAAALLPATRYESTAVLSVQPQGGSPGFDSQQAIQIVIPQIIARLTSNGFYDDVRDNLSENLRDAPITISASSDPGTAIVRVGVSSSRPDPARSIANQAVEQIGSEQASNGFILGTLNPPSAAVNVKRGRAIRIILGALVLGVIAATLLAAFLHRVRPPLPRAVDFRSRYRHQVLGEIPMAGEGVGDAEIAEAFRSLETRIRQGILARGGDPTACSIAVTSWTALEGKTTVTANLAKTIAAYGAPITAVDCDLRRPSLHQQLGAELAPGLADGPPVGKLRQRGPARSLDVIAAGDAQRHPSEIVSEMVPLVLPLLHDRAVLLDTPPMFTAETTVIASAADYLVLVADYTARKPDEVEQALEELELAGTPVLGVVLNRASTDDNRGRDKYVYRPVSASQTA